MHLTLTQACILGATLFMGGFFYGRYTLVARMVQLGALVFVRKESPDEG